MKTRRTAFIPDVCIDNCTGLPGTILAFGPDGHFRPFGRRQFWDCEGDPTPEVPSDTPLPPLVPWTETVGVPERCWIRRKINQIHNLTDEEDAEFGEEEVMDWDVCDWWDAGFGWAGRESWVESDPDGVITSGESEAWLSEF